MSTISNEELRAQLEKIIDPIVTGLGFDLVDIELKGSINNRVVRIYIDKDGGVSLDDCVAVSRASSDEIDMADLFPGRYRLEVSSPGIDRPLRTKRDFQRNLGRSVAVNYRPGVERAAVEGTIEEISDLLLKLKCKDQTVNIPFDEIESAKIQVKL